MTPSGTSTNRTCPVCGARNSGISLFCAECGSSLNADVDRSGDTAAIPTQSAASRHTGTFSTASPASQASSGTSGTQRWSAHKDPRQDETAPFQTDSAPTSPPPASNRWATLSNGAATGAFPSDVRDQDDQPVPVTMVERQATGARGFFLGLLAILLIVVVLGLYGWTAWLSADLRDTVSGWFGFTG